MNHCKKKDCIDPAVSDLSEPPDEEELLMRKRQQFIKQYNESLNSPPPDPKALMARFCFNPIYEMNPALKDVMVSLDQKQMSEYKRIYGKKEQKFTETLNQIKKMRGERLITNKIPQECTIRELFEVSKYLSKIRNLHLDIIDNLSAIELRIYDLRFLDQFIKRCKIPTAGSAWDKWIINIQNSLREFAKIKKSGQIPDIKNFDSKKIDKVIIKWDYFDYQMHISTFVYYSYIKWSRQLINIIMTENYFTVLQALTPQISSHLERQRVSIVEPPKVVYDLGEYVFHTIDKNPDELEDALLSLEMIPNVMPKEQAKEHLEEPLPLDKSIILSPKVCANGSQGKQQKTISIGTVGRFIAIGHNPNVVLAEWKAPKSEEHRTFTNFSIPEIECQKSKSLAEEYLPTETSMAAPINSTTLALPENAGPSVNQKLDEMMKTAENELKEHIRVIKKRTGGIEKFEETREIEETEADPIIEKHILNAITNATKVINKTTEEIINTIETKPAIFHKNYAEIDGNVGIINDQHKDQERKDPIKTDHIKKATEDELQRQRKTREILRQKTFVEMPRPDQSADSTILPEHPPILKNTLPISMDRELKACDVILLYGKIRIGVMVGKKNNYFISGQTLQDIKEFNDKLEKDKKYLKSIEKNKSFKNIAKTSSTFSTSLRIFILAELEEEKYLRLYGPLVDELTNFRRAFDQSTIEKSFQFATIKDFNDGNIKTIAYFFKSYGDILQNVLNKRAKNDVILQYKFLNFLVNDLFCFVPNREPYWVKWADILRNAINHAATKGKLNVDTENSVELYGKRENIIDLLPQSLKLQAEMYFEYLRFVVIQDEILQLHDYFIPLFKYLYE